MFIKYGVKYDTIALSKDDYIALRNIYKSGITAIYYYIHSYSGYNPYMRLSVVNCQKSHNEIHNSHGYNLIYSIRNTINSEFEEKLTYYYKYDMERNNIYKYNIYMSLPLLEEYLNDKDLYNFAKEVDEKFPFMLKYDWELGSKFRFR
jgi:hypothetical protein